MNFHQFPSLVEGGTSPGSSAFASDGSAAMAASSGRNRPGVGKKWRTVWKGSNREMFSCFIFVGGQVGGVFVFGDDLSGRHV